MNRVKVKVCGMTDPEQVAALVDLGIDAIGMILYAESPRKIDLQQAQAIREAVPDSVKLVGVFVDAKPAEITQIAKELPLDLIQLHGIETNQTGRALEKPFIKAIRAKSADQVNSELKAFPDACSLLIDPYVHGIHGGTGQRLSSDLWPSSAQIEILQEQRSKRGNSQSGLKLILAGGLAADNIKSASELFKPYAVDLNSGVESAPGVKDIDKVELALKQLWN